MLKDQIKLRTSSQTSYESTTFIVWQLKEMEARINFKYHLYFKSVYTTNGGMIHPVWYNVLGFVNATAIPFEENHSSFLQYFQESCMYSVTLEIP